MIKPTEKCCRSIQDRALAGRQAGQRAAHHEPAGNCPQLQWEIGHESVSLTTSGSSGLANSDASYASHVSGMCADGTSIHGITPHKDAGTNCHIRAVLTVPAGAGSPTAMADIRRANRPVAIRL